MAIERRQPLPPARYWLDVFGRSNVDTFDIWLGVAGPGNVRVERRESSAPDTAWFLFETLTPLPFDQKRFGFPTIAEPNVQTRADTSDRPAEQTPGAFLGDFFKQFEGAGSVLLLIGLAYLASKSKS